MDWFIFYWLEFNNILEKYAEVTKVERSASSSRQFPN